MKLSNYLKADYIFTNLEVETKEDIIREMIDKIALKNKNVEKDKNNIMEQVLKREGEFSTCMGRGILIPHARIEKFDDFIISIGIVKSDLYDKIHGSDKIEKVEIIFMIISDILRNKSILKTISAISKIAMRNQDILEKIKKEENPYNIIEIIKETKMEIDNKITASDIVSTEVIPAFPTDTLDVIATRLIVEKVSGIAVVDNNNNFLGEITEKELIEFGMPEHLSLMNDLNFLTVGEPFEDYFSNERTQTIEEMYRKDLSEIIIDKRTPILEVCFNMVYKGRHRLYVVEDGKYCGMISRSDIIKRVLHI